MLKAIDPCPARKHPRENKTGSSTTANKSSGEWSVASDEQAPLPHASPHGIAVHVLQLFQPFLFRPDTHVVESPWPDAVMRFVVNGSWQSQSVYHLSAPGVVATFQEVAQNEFRGPLFQGFDLVLLDANPLTDITNVRRIRAVVVAGRFLDRKELDSVLAQVRIAVRQQ